MRSATVFFTVIVLSTAACSESGNPGRDGSTTDAGQTPDTDRVDHDVPVTTGPTYHGDIAPIIEQNCIGCHDPGGIGPFELDSYESVSGVADLALSAIESGTMPPWLPDPTCRPMQDERVMSDDQKALFREWIEADKPEGSPDDAPGGVDENDELEAPDIRARPSGAYRPTVEAGDEYRCFLLDAEFTEDTFVTRLNVDPGNRSLVHHSNMFVANPINVPRVEELEASDSEPGYPCFGDAGISNVNLIGAWVPGMEPIEIPDGYAVRIPAGSRIVMQTHFNSLYTDVADVAQEFQIWTRDTPPDKIVRGLPIANLDLDIPAGERNAEHVLNIPYLGDEPLEIIGTAAHLHLLAEEVKLEIIRNGNEHSCLLDIPHWDFSWQQAYFYEREAWTTVDPGDTIRLTCTFDNSPENQPLVDGERLMPRDVSWGGGTFDEMCIAFMIVAEDYEPLPDGDLCEAFHTCRDDCDDPFGIGCVFNCAVEETDCGECLVFAAQDCGQRHCPDELREASPCLYTCAQGAQAGGDIDQCLRDECPDKRDALETCLRPALETGLCNEDLRDCNVQL